MKLKNEIRFIDDKTIEIILHNGIKAIADIDDYEKLKKYRWSAQYVNETKSHRARAYIPEAGKAVKMHRLIAGVSDRNIVVDHINHNTLDNRKSNLRKCLKSENNMNRSKQRNNVSGFKGVSYHRKSKKYMSMIWLNNKPIYLGLFNDKIQAAISYDDAAIKYYGEYALLNFKRDNLQLLNKEA